MELIMHMSDDEFRAMLRKSGGRVGQIFDRYEAGEPITTPEEEEEYYKLECMENFIDYNDIEMTRADMEREFVEEEDSIYCF